MHKQEQDSGLIQNGLRHQNVVVALFSLLTADEPDGEHAAELVALPEIHRCITHNNTHIDTSPSLLFWTSAISEYS